VRRGDSAPARASEDRECGGREIDIPFEPHREPAALCAVGERVAGEDPAEGRGAATASGDRPARAEERASELRVGPRERRARPLEADLDPPILLAALRFDPLPRPERVDAEKAEWNARMPRTPSGMSTTAPIRREKNTIRARGTSRG
jgi:hypothetical protein